MIVSWRPIIFSKPPKPSIALQLCTLFRDSLSGSFRFSIIYRSPSIFFDVVQNIWKNQESLQLCTFFRDSLSGPLRLLLFTALRAFFQFFPKYFKKSIAAVVRTFSGPTIWALTICYYLQLSEHFFNFFQKFQKINNSILYNSISAPPSNPKTCTFKIFSILECINI